VEVCILTLSYIQSTHTGIRILKKSSSFAVASTYSFHGAEGDISDDLSGGGGDGETDGLVLGGLVSEGILVDILEDFVETELSESLGTVADEGGEPSLNKNGVFKIRKDRI